VHHPGLFVWKPDIVDDFFLIFVKINGTHHQAFGFIALDLEGKISFHSKIMLGGC